MTQSPDQLPWYKHRWPWIIILMLGSAVTASLYTLYIASQGNDSLVLETGDAAGTDVVTERNIAAQVAAMDRGLSANMIVDTNSGAISIVLTSGELAENPPTLELWISHPTFAERDERTTVTTAMRDESGRQTWAGVLLDIPVGKRYVVLSDGDAWRLNGVWDGEPVVRLTPAGPVADD